MGPSGESATGPNCGDSVVFLGESVGPSGGSVGPFDWPVRPTVWSVGRGIWWISVALGCVRETPRESVTLFVESVGN